VYGHSPLGGSRLNNEKEYAGARPIMKHATLMIRSAMVDIFFDTIRVAIIRLQSSLVVFLFLFPAE
jgi:hypothetical protein